MARLLRRVPAYTFDVGGPIELIPPAIEAVLRDLDA
jgi:hypothetical protein